jgi:hypothetical protein
MYVAVEHTISNPQAFWAKAGEILPNLPNHVKLHQCFPTRDGSHGICIWEGQSISAVRSYLEEHVGNSSSNEYFEVENKDDIALPSGITSPGQRRR